MDVRRYGGGRVIASVYDGTTPAIITAPSPVDVVLEVPLGFASTHAIMVENNVEIYETQ